MQAIEYYTVHDSLKDQARVVIQSMSGQLCRAILNWALGRTAKQIELLRIRTQDAVSFTRAHCFQCENQCEEMCSQTLAMRDDLDALLQDIPNHYLARDIRNGIRDIRDMWDDLADDIILFGTKDSRDALDEIDEILSANAHRLPDIDEVDFLS